MILLNHLSCASILVGALTQLFLISMNELFHMKVYVFLQYGNITSQLSHADIYIFVSHEQTVIAVIICTCVLP